MTLSSFALVYCTLWLLPPLCLIIYYLCEVRRCRRLHTSVVREREVIFATLPFKHIFIERMRAKASEAAEDEAAPIQPDTHIGLRLDSLLRPAAGHVLVKVKGFECEGTPIDQVFDCEEDPTYWMICLN